MNNQRKPCLCSNPAQVPFQETAQRPMGDVEQGAAVMPAPNGQDQGDPNVKRGDKDKKKPWYKRTWVWIVVAVVLILGLAFGQGGSKDASALASSDSTQPAASQPSKETFDLQTLVGKKWNEASQTLTDHLWTDNEYTAQTDDGKTPILVATGPSLPFPLTLGQSSVSNTTQLKLHLPRRRQTLECLPNTLPPCPRLVPARA